MLRLPLVLGSVAGLLAIATACSSYWSVSATARPMKLDVADAPVTYDVTLELAADDDEPLPCDLLSWDLALDFTEASDGTVAYEVLAGDEWAGEVDLSEDRNVLVASYGAWTETSDRLCRADAVLVLSSPHAARGGFTVRATAQDGGAGPDDNPRGATTFEVRVR